MTIKHYGKSCSYCEEGFGFISITTKCEFCGNLSHNSCVKATFVIEQIKDLDFSKKNACKSCYSKHKDEFHSDQESINLVAAYSRGFSEGYSKGEMAGRRNGHLRS